jgi:RNA polymerase sigma-54 factor
MAQSLQLSQRLTQSLVLAPQLQQSLALLQAPTLELKALVEQELQQNPVLEEVQEADTDKIEKEEAAEKLDPTEPPSDLNFDPATEKPNNEPVDDFQAEFERLLQLDQEWRDHFAQTNVPMRSSQEDEEKRQFMFDSLVAGTSLQEMLLEQVRESSIPQEQWPIAELLIGNIDDYGYLKTTVEELAASTGLPQEQILAVLKVVQSFEPPGVAARDLRECLLLQLDRSGQQSTLEYRIVHDFMEALGKRRIPEIARGTGTEVDEVQDALENIGKLEPRPGRAYLPDNDQYILPEVFVQRSGDE